MAAKEYTAKVMEPSLYIDFLTLKLANLVDENNYN